MQNSRGLNTRDNIHETSKDSRMIQNDSSGQVICLCLTCKNDIVDIDWSIGGHLECHVTMHPNQAAQDASKQVDFR